MMSSNYSIDTFVQHCREVGVKHRDCSQADFELLFDYDMMNAAACPVFVYELRGEPVAWYDEENEWGYVIDSQSK